jgi:hypothetical protein
MVSVNVQTGPKAMASFDHTNLKPAEQPQDAKHSPAGRAPANAAHMLEGLLNSFDEKGLRL